MRLFGARAVLAAVVIYGVGCQPAYQWNGEPVDSPAPAPPLVGTNWDGSAFSLEDVRGKIAVVFFGYTFCPDVCPFTLAKMKQVMTGLGERSDEVAVVFVSVDPHRDTVAKIAGYVPNFDQRFYGLHLDFDAVSTTADEWGVTVQNGQPKDGPGTPSFYYVDHSGTFFVVDREGVLRLKFGPKVTVEAMVPDLEALLAG